MGPASESGGVVGGVEQAARLERETAAADARRQPAADRLQHLDPLVELARPTARQSLPVALRRRLVRGQRVQRVPDPLERDPRLLAGLDERDSSERRRDVAPLVALGALRGDQSLPFVEPQGGLRYTASLGELADGHLT